MSPREIQPPGGRYKGLHAVYTSDSRGWKKLCQSMPGPMHKCYIELADNPFPHGQLRRHHQMKGKLKEFWEYEVAGGARVRYKRGINNEIIVVYAGAAPPDTH